MTSQGRDGKRVQSGRGENFGSNFATAEEEKETSVANNETEFLHSAE
jgi:hypothetical protein